MIEKEINKIVSWEEINNILEESRRDLVYLRMPESVYRHYKMKYKIQMLKENMRVFIEVKSRRRGRKRKIDDTQRVELLNYLKEGYSIRGIAEITDIPKSTIYDYIKDEMEKVKKEQLKELIYEFRELFIEKDLYKFESVKILFKEIENALEVGDYEHVMKLFSELKEYFD